MIYPILLGIDSDHPQPARWLAEGQPILLYLRIGEQSLVVGEELFYTWALPTGFVATSAYRKHVVADSLEDLKGALEKRVAECGAPSWDGVFDRLRAFAWYECDSPI